MASRQMQVHRRVSELGMSKQHLDRSEICSGLQQVSRKTMPQRMGIRAGPVIGGNTWRTPPPRAWRNERCAKSSCGAGAHPASSGEDGSQGNLLVTHTLFAVNAGTCHNCSIRRASGFVQTPFSSLYSRFGRPFGMYGPPPPLCKRKMRKTELVCANVSGLCWSSDLLA
jgi:hypothetical protein